MSKAEHLDQYKRVCMLIIANILNVPNIEMTEIVKAYCQLHAAGGGISKQGWQCLVSIYFTNICVLFCFDVESRQLYNTETWRKLCTRIQGEHNYGPTHKKYILDKLLKEQLPNSKDNMNELLEEHVIIGITSRNWNQVLCLVVGNI